MESVTTANRHSRRRPGPIGWLMEDTLAGMARRKALLGYLFLLPTILGILTFTAGPLIVSLGLSLFEWSVIRPARFAGLENFQRLFHDSRVLTSFSNTVKMVIMAVSLQITLGLIVALAVQQRMSRWLRYYFRTAFFLPLLTSGASVAIVLGYMFHKEWGVINYYLKLLLGIPAIPWLNVSGWVLIAMVLAYVWQHLGFTFITFVGGLGNISQDILDAAAVDGAVGWRRLWYITLPMLSPTILFAAVVGIIGTLQIFDQPYVMTRGGPGDASRTVVMVIYEAAFKNLEIGYGSTIAVFLFALILIVTLLQFWSSKRWVFYQ